MAPGGQAVSNHPRHRRRLQGAARTRAILADTDPKAPGLVMFGSGKGDGTLHHPIVVDRVMYLVAVPPAGASDNLLWAYSARATASVTGSCPICGAGRHVRTSRLEFHHEADCPAGDNNLVAGVQAERSP
jgi:hypothetical protein